MVERCHAAITGTFSAAASQAWVDDCASMARDHSLAVHVDGARLFNAAAASGISPARLVRDATTVSACLSKGLGAPIGSVLAGPAALIARARHIRKALGGGMRQAGVVAAAGIVGLAENVPALAADHARAAMLARGLSGIPGVVVPRAPETNIVFFNVNGDVRHFLEVHPSGGCEEETFCIPSGTVKPTMDASAAFAAMVFAIAGVRVGAYGHGRLRAVTHHQVTDEDISVFVGAAAVAVRLLVG